MKNQRGMTCFTEITVQSEGGKDKENVLVKATCCTLEVKTK